MVILSAKCGGAGVLVICDFRALVLLRRLVLGCKGEAWGGICVNTVGTDLQVGRGAHNGVTLQGVVLTLHTGIHNPLNRIVAAPKMTAARIPARRFVTVS